MCVLAECEVNCRGAAIACKVDADTRVDCKLVACASNREIAAYSE